MSMWPRLSALRMKWLSSAHAGRPATSTRKHAACQPAGQIASASNSDWHRSRSPAVWTTPVVYTVAAHSTHAPAANIRLVVALADHVITPSS